MRPAPEPLSATDDIDVLLAAVPPEIVAAIDALVDREGLIEVVMDLGRRPEARYPDSEVELLDREIDEADIQYVVEHIGSFGDDNRAGIERTLHRISAIRNRNGKIVGLTCRIGRAVYGTIEIIADFVETGKSLLIMGRPGIGKTTMLREAARVLADDLDKRVVVVDTSNEIAGDGDIPHPAIGKARRMQVRTPSLQHEVMIEAVENHMPQVIVIDEIGTELEAAAARTIAERGVQLIGTAHGNTLDNLMLNPTLSDLIGGIQSVTLGDEEARRRRSQKSVLERKAPPTFDVVIEIQDRERVLVHGEVADTVDALLRGDPIAPELRWRDEEGVHRSQSRPRPSPREQLVPDRFSGLIGAGGGGWRTEPGWRGDSGFRGGVFVPGGGERATRSGFRPGSSGSWRPGRSGPGSGPGTPVAAGSAPGARAEAPFVAGDIADRGPLERGSIPVPEPRARDARELSRQREWRESAAKAIDALKAEEGTGPVNVAELAADDEALMDRAREAGIAEDGEALHIPDAEALPTLRVLPQGISRKRLEQAIRELQLPVIIARDVDEADVVMTIRSEYKQKTPMVREAEERAMPIYVLKTNTIPQMQSSLTSIFALEIDPRDAALRETEEAIGVVLDRAEAVELSPQNAYIRRLQHQMAERANLVSRSRGREPYRRVRLYPDPARSPWR
ncbi:MAG TPA: R3H domain-containing nucleic acid-binding protein [Patescibacteria group bacterium]|nr:R3H domain-containing nucleic acid-binding protein [Patescibacteria group bacterium]